MNLILLHDAGKDVIATITISIYHMIQLHINIPIRLLGLLLLSMVHQILYIRDVRHVPSHLLSLVLDHISLPKHLVAIYLRELTLLQPLIHKLRHIKLFEEVLHLPHVRSVFLQP